MAGLTEMPKVGERIHYVGDCDYGFLTRKKDYVVTRVDTKGFWFEDDNGQELTDALSNWELVTAEDAVNSPAHYRQGAVEVIDYIDQVADSYVGKQAAYAGNIIKYVSRAPYKNGAIDIRKAIWYAQRLADAMEAEASE